MSRLHFQQGHSYRSTEDGIMIPVEIVWMDRQVQLFAVLDTGAEFCIFDRRLAESMGIDVESGLPIKLRTLAGTFTAYGHELTLRAYEREWSATVYFHDQSMRPYANFLGRTGWLDRVRLGLVHYDRQIYVEQYDEPSN